MSVSSTDLQSSLAEELAALCNLWSTYIGISQNCKKCQIPKDLRILAFFPDLQYSNSKCSDPKCKVNQPFLCRHTYKALDWKKLRHFACQYRALRARIYQICKKVSESWDLQESVTLSDFQDSTSKWSNLAYKMLPHLLAGAVRICVGRKGLNSSKFTVSECFYCWIEKYPKNACSIRILTNI